MAVFQNERLVIGLLLLLTVCPFYGNAQPPAIDTLYEQHDHHSFFQLAQVQQRIELMEVDVQLLGAAVFFETNRIRDKHHRPPFSWSSSLQKAAVQHSQAMVEHQFNGHRNPYDTAWSTPEKRMKKMGWETPIMGENVAEAFLLQYESGDKLQVRQENGKTVYYRKSFFGLVTRKVKRHTYQSFARSVVDRWMHSPGHRKNILRKKYTHLGCGVFTPSYAQNTQGLPSAKVIQNFGGKQ